MNKRVLKSVAIFFAAHHTPADPPLSAATARDQVPQSTSIWSADGELLRVTLAADDQYRLWTPLSEMSPALVDAFRLKEDRWFYWHPGVNPVSLVRAAA